MNSYLEEVLNDIINLLAVHAEIFLGRVVQSWVKITQGWKLKSISVLILFVYKSTIRSAKNNRENYPRKCSLTPGFKRLSAFEQLSPGLLSFDSEYQQLSSRQYLTVRLYSFQYLQNLEENRKLTKHCYFRDQNILILEKYTVQGVFQEHVIFPITKKEKRWCYVIYFIISRSLMTYM